ncbi:MAG: isoleucine--tRNA ligase [Clostridia bacterium]|nr:isoleucine--tRNA ligase [Clostridia bacterium]
MNLEKLDNIPDFSKMQKEILEFWEKEKTFEKSVNKNKNQEVVFYDGPPFPTGMPHHGTVLVSFIKDMIARYWTMKGYSVPRVWGWDCHGLPIETQAEKILGITDKKQIESEFGVDRFNEACYSVVVNNNDAWKTYVKEMCRWVDYDNAYKTMNVDFMESVLWAFKQCYNKGLIYQDYRVTPYCYRCETALSISDTRESDSTRPKQDTWCIAKFKTEETLNNKPVYLLAWTTTPWTLFSNMALAVNSEFEYAYVEVENEIYVAGKSILSKYAKIFGENPNIVKCCKGKDLENTEYEPVCDYFMDKKQEGAFKVILADFVELDEGVGIVHIAPGFGEDDYWASKNNNIPLVCPVDEKGRYTEVIKAFAGKNVMEANMDVLRYLKSQNKVIMDGSLVHNYPHCWRCKTPLIYKSMDAWYFNVEKVKDKLIKYNGKINWIPETVKEGRFGNWLKNARDWNISRNRYWSTPIPIWECVCCHERKVLGSIKEIEDVSNIKLDNLHRQYMDKVIFNCTCGGTFKRVPEVLDCWFESASVPFAQKHYPFENKEWFDSHFPCDFIVEYTGQIRCWFYYLHVLAVALFDKPAFKNCVVHGTILAKDGKKLSKSSKNYTDPMDLMKQYGTDAFRLYLFRSNAIIMNDLSFDENGIKSQVQQVLLPLYNCAKFFNSYALLDKFNPEEMNLPKSDNELDKWILAKLYDTENKISLNMKDYQIDNYVEPIIELIDGFSNWYIRRSRRRFWSLEQTQDKKNAYETTYYVLLNICKILAPIAPVISESLYKHFTGNESIHLSNWSEVPEEYKNEEILKQTDLVQRIITLARYLREKENIKNRQPLSKVEIAFTDKDYSEVIKNFNSIICDEINVKQVQVLQNIEELASIEYIPNFKAIGPKYGSKVSEITKLIKANKIQKCDDGYVLNLSDETLKLDIEDVNIRYLAKDGNKVENDKDIIVRLDTELTEELKDEGLAREIVRNIQDARKQLNLEIADRIMLELDGELTESSKEYICNETLADMTSFENEDFKCEVLANGKRVYVRIKK